jgi:U3 small nucleolar RNA-associated protein MPP10
MLAPEELFAPPRAKTLTARTELTPEQKQRARAKARKAKAATVKHLGDMAELYGKKNKGKVGKEGVREEKDRALKGLVKGGKGVTVVGKGGERDGRKRKSGDQDGMTTSREDGKKLKL